LEAFDRAWGAAGEKGDRAALQNIYADDYMSHGIGEMTNKTQAIEDTMKQFERDKANPQMADKVTHDYYMITCTPTTATITHRNVITTKFGTGGKEETFYTRSVHFLEKRNERWQVVSNAGGAIDDYAALIYMEREWGDAIKNRDTNWFERNLASDFSEINFMTGELMNKSAAMAALKADKTIIDSFDMQNTNVRIDGNTAVITGSVQIKGRDEKNQPVDMRLRYTDTFIKRDGRWQAWASHPTLMPSKK
jgi:ketosteroid isomerase-like protein